MSLPTFQSPWTWPPGLHVISFSPREPQQLDKIVLRLGPLPKASLSGGIKDFGPATTAHAINLPWPADKKMQLLVGQARQGSIGKALKQIRRYTRSQKANQPGRQLQSQLEQWLQQQLDTIKADAENGRQFDAADRLAVLKQLTTGITLDKALLSNARKWTKSMDHQAGTVFFRLLNQTAQASEAEFIQFMTAFKQRYPAVRFHRPGPWWYPLN